MANKVLVSNSKVSGVSFMVAGFSPLVTGHDSVAFDKLRPQACRKELVSV